MLPVSNIIRLYEENVPWEQSVLVFYDPIPYILLCFCKDLIRIRNFMWVCNDRFKDLANDLLTITSVTQVPSDEYDNNSGSTTAAKISVSFRPDLN